TPRYDELRGPEDHGRLYFDCKMLKYLDFIIKNPINQDLDRTEDVSTEDSVSNLRYCLNIFKEKGMSVIAIDRTSADVSTTGLCVVKVLIPGMHPIGFGMHNQRLGGQRLYSSPVELGYADVETREEELNLVPHFFA